MIKEAFGKGVTTEEAIEAAKTELNAPEDADVQVEVVEAAKRKTLGLFGGSLAKVRAYYEAPDEVIKKVKNEIKQPKVNNKPKQPQPKAEAKPDKVEKKAEPKSVTTPNSGTEGEFSKKAEEYIRCIVEGMGVSDMTVHATEDEESVNVQLECDSDYGFIIGRRGETLDSIQYLTRLVINRGNDVYKRVSINAGNYREKREETLRELARKNSLRVKKYGRNVCLDPMNPYERRIIHTTIQEIEGVDSHSVGSENERRVVITLADGFEAEKHGYNNNRGGARRNDYRRNDSRPSSSNTPDAPSREPRSDSNVVGLYGKIEPKE